MGYTEKIDALDMIINVLREHEKVFDEQLNRMGDILEKMERGQPHG